MTKSFQLSKGVFVLSLDTELAWARAHNENYRVYRRQLEATRAAIDSLLNLFVEYEISATWAIVGHLFLDHCTEKNGLVHPDIVRPQYKWLKGDWFEHDPCTEIGRDPIWYGKDIVEKIRDCPVYQEIGSHSFSHILFGEEGCSREAAESDLNKCVELADLWGIQLESFVFPQNKVGHLDCLERNGFLCYRGLKSSWYSYWPGFLRPVCKAINISLALPAPCYLPEKTNALVNISLSMPYRGYARPGGGLFRLIPVKRRVRQAIKGIDRAIREKKLFHLALHPLDFGIEGKSLLLGLEQILDFVLQKVERQSLFNLTMGQLAREMRQN